MVNADANPWATFRRLLSCGNPSARLEPFEDEASSGHLTDAVFAKLLLRASDAGQIQPCGAIDTEASTGATGFLASHGATLCHYAALAGRVDWLERCREAGGDAWVPIIDLPAGPLAPGERDRAPIPSNGPGRTLAHFAAAGGHVAALAWLADTMGADYLRLRDRRCNSGAVWAALYGRVAALVWLHKTLGDDFLRQRRVIVVDKTAGWRAELVGDDDDGADGAETVAMVAAEGGELEALRCIRAILGPSSMREGTVLYSACLGGSVECVAFVVDEIGLACVRTSGPGQRPPTFAAAGTGNVAVLEYLRSRIGDEVLFWRCPTHGKNLLHTAAWNGQSCVFDYVYSRVGSRVMETTCDRGCAPLEAVALRVLDDSACVTSNNKRISLIRILQHYADHSALGAAVLGRPSLSVGLTATGSVEILALLVQHAGVDVLQHEHGTAGTPAHVAAGRGHVDLLRYIVDTAGPDVLYRVSAGRSPAHTAADRGRVDVLSFMCDAAGSQVLRQPTPNGSSLAHVAAGAGKVEVLDFLREQLGDDCLLETTSSGAGVAHCGAQHIHVLQYLAETVGRDSFRWKSDGCTVAGCAVEDGSRDVLEWLALPASDGGGDCAELVMATASSANTVCWAAYEGRLNIVTFAFEFAGPAAFTATSDAGMSAAASAAMAGRAEIVEFIAKSCGVEALQVKNSDGAVLLPLAAAKGGNVDILKLIAPMLGEAMLVRTRGASGWTIAELAAASGHVDVLRWIARGLRGGAAMLRASGPGNPCTYAELAAAHCGQTAALEFLERRYVRASQYHHQARLRRDTMALLAIGEGHVATLEFIESSAVGAPSILRKGDVTAIAASSTGSMHALRHLAGVRDHAEEQQAHAASCRDAVRLPSAGGRVPRIRSAKSAPQQAPAKSLDRRKEAANTARAPWR